MKTSNLKTILSVSQLNAQCKKTLENNFPQIWVDGEVSNFIRAGSGHWYFSLKDSKSQIRCAMFKFKNSALSFIPENGMQVTLRAKITLYEPRGDYQLICEYIELSGDGKLLREYEILKQKLTKQGLFDSQYKKVLPQFPKTVGIISSSDGAAVHDILNVLNRRSPSMQVILYPSLVQGSSAAVQLRQALQDAQQEIISTTQTIKCDLIIISRGGGSLEDLNAFNDEQLAQDIFTCSIPIVSAVGHEIDFTICDFVADVRAPTPSAAAEIISQDESQWLQWLEQINNRLFDLINKKITYKNNELSWLAKQLKHPSSKLETIRQRLDELSFRQNQAISAHINNNKQRLKLQFSQLKHFQPEQQLKQSQQKLSNLQQALEKIILQIIQENKTKLNNSVEKLDVLSPLSIMSRGYALISKETNTLQPKLIKSKEELDTDDIVKIRFAKDSVLAKVIKPIQKPFAPIASTKKFVIPSR